MNIRLDSRHDDPRGERGSPAPGEGPRIQLEEASSPAVIKVIGVGGGGCNSINRMMAAGVAGVEFIAVNTDAQALEQCTAPVKVQLGPEVTRGLGAGADPDIGRRAAVEDTDRLHELVTGADMVFVTCGMGGGTGTGAAPVIAQIASQADALTVAVVTKPFPFEGTRRRRVAEEGIAQLEAHVDTLITIPNERLLKFVDRSTSFTDALRIADDVLRQAVQGIADIITKPGLINRDFADVRTVMKDMGHAIMGVGAASGEHRAVEAAQQAIASPLLEETSIAGARGILINLTGGADMTLTEVNEAAEIITESADRDAIVLFGAVVDPDLEGEFRVTVIATGFGGEATERRTAEAEAERPAEEGARPRSPFLEPSDPWYGIHGTGAPKEEYEVPAILRNQLD